VSGYSGPILTQQALAAGVSELLTKPLQSRKIAATLARVLHRGLKPPTTADLCTAGTSALRRGGIRDVRAAK